MIQCPKCKQVLETGVRFCPNDGTPLTETAGISTVQTPSGVRPASVELALPVLVGGRYRLEEKRGGGGMAKVYRAVDVTLDREVAVKLINPELRSEPEFDARFEREARIASQLSDPHIVVVHDYGLDPVYGPFLVMEYLKGETLRERLHSGGPLPFKATLQLGAQLLLALIHAHDKNICHRDIKPDNVFLLNQSGVRLHLRVLDFGIARIYRRDDPSRSETLTSVGAVLGTPRYMSPEQLAGQPVDARSDLYSAALVIHEALTGQLPYVSGKKLSELCPEATAVLEELLDQCLKPNPAERPSGALEVYLRLQELGKASGVLLLPPGALDKLAAARRDATGSGVLTPPATTVPTWKPPFLLRKGPRRLLYALAACLAVVGLAILIKSFLVHDEPPKPPKVESLLDVKIGDPQQTVVDNLDLVHGGSMKDPWEKDPPEYLGMILTPALLGLAADDLDRLDVRRSKDDKVCVVFFDNKVRAVVVRSPHPGDTGRAVGVGSKEDALNDRFGDADDQHKVQAKPPAKGYKMVRFYKTLGVGFEMQDRVVTAVTLYPPSPSGQ